MLSASKQDYYHVRCSTCPPNSDTISKHNTSNNWPTRSIIAEWIGKAYISGSFLIDHNQLVSRRAITSEVKTCSQNNTLSLDIIAQRNIDMKMTLTAQQKNSIENTINIAGTCSHPTDFKTTRNTISTGRVIRRSVSMTRRPLGWLWGCSKGLGSTAAWRAVERRETKMEPAAPGRPENQIQPVPV